MPMALPQTHLIAFCSDLGIAPTHGAAMLSVVLGSGFLCRQLWGLFSDRTGGLATLVVCSAIQASALDRVPVDAGRDRPVHGAACSGWDFSGLVPAYVLAMRELFPVREARWRVPTLLLFSGSGMAVGGWLGGALYDMFGYYGPAFFAAIAANLFNFANRAEMPLLRRIRGRTDVSGSLRGVAAAGIVGLTPVWLIKCTGGPSAPWSVKQCGQTGTVKRTGLFEGRPNCPPRPEGS